MTSNPTREITIPNPTLAPTALAGLIEALARLPRLDPLDRARACPALIDSAKATIAAVRGYALLEARAAGETQRELARQVDVHETRVGVLIAAAQARQKDRGGSHHRNVRLSHATVAPTALADLIEHLARLPHLGPIDRARACPALIERAKATIAAIRGDAVLDARTPGQTQRELARQLGINENKVGHIIAAAQARSDAP